MTYRRYNENKNSNTWFLPLTNTPKNKSTHGVSDKKGEHNEWGLEYKDSLEQETWHTALYGM